METVMPVQRRLSAVLGLTRPSSDCCVCANVAAGIESFLSSGHRGNRAACNVRELRPKHAALLWLQDVVVLGRHRHSELLKEFLFRPVKLELDVGVDLRLLFARFGILDIHVRSFATCY